MELLLERSYKGPNYTIGHLYIDGKYFCDTIEDKVRKLENAEDKVYGETAIPAGTYKISMTWSPHFKRILPLLENVPYFTGVRIHRGNTEKDSLGCIIVGENKVKGKVINSTGYEKKLVEILSKSNNITITIA